MNHARALCSIATQDHLPKAVALYRSVLRHQDLPLYLLVPDIGPHEGGALARELTACLDGPAAGRLHVIVPQEIYGSELSQMRFYYDAFEFSVACKPGLHAWMLRHTTADAWLYLDADMLCFGSLAPVFERLETGSILLTPHAANGRHALNSDLQYLSAGAFNAGLSGLRRSPEAEAFTAWYLRVLRFLCLNDLALPPQERFSHSTVMFADQRWLDLVPAYFGKVVVAPERGFNLGHWNVGADRLNRREAGLHIGDDRVLLLHLSGWQEDVPGRLSRHSPLDWSDDPVWAVIHDEYREVLRPLQAQFAQPYPFNAYADGSPIKRAHRRRYLQHLLQGGAPAADPFGQSPPA